MKKIYFVKLFSVCIILALGITASAQPATLRAHFKFDDAAGTVATDASGNGFNGTVTGTANWVEGTLGGALELVTDAGVTLSAPPMTMTSDNGSVALWVKCNAPTGMFTLFSAGDNTDGSGFGPENEIHLHLEEASASWTGGEVSFWLLGSGANTFLYSDPTKGEDPSVAPVSPVLVADNAWHHIVATWGGTAAMLYIDGVKIVEKPYASASFALSNMFLGQMLGGGRRYIGIIDDARIYTGVLNDFQIADLFNKVTSVEGSVAEDASALTVYPNPAKSDLTARFFSNTSASAKVSLVSLTGQILETTEMNTVAGINHASFDPSKYSQGVYFVKLEVDGKVSHSKVVID
ncbi:MAG: T9SS type A sorting domain-containing protein [Bacteroidales bacterium]|nr:T9SS type A sorting domain-containing protein [Bacteroidales bacterium]